MLIYAQLIFACKSVIVDLTAMNASAKKNAQEFISCSVLNEMSSWKKVKVSFLIMMKTLELVFNLVVVGAE